MLPKPLQRVAEAAMQMLVERLLGAGLVVVGRLLVENAPIAGLLQIGRHAEDEPMRIVVESATNIVIPALRQRLVLVISAAAIELRRGQVENPLPRSRRHHVHKSQQVLVGIAETEPSANTRLERRRRARHIKCGHALVCVPDVHHAIRVHIRRVHLEDAEKLVPVRAQAIESRIGLSRPEIPCDHRLRQLLVDGLRTGRIELLVLRVFLVPENEDDLPRLSGSEIELYLMSADWRPSVRDRVRQLPGGHGRGIVPAAVRAKKSVARRIVSLTAGSEHAKNAK